MANRITVNTRDFQKLISDLSDLPEDVASDAYDFYVKKTPIRSGNARSRTRLRDTKIISDYAYAGRLDDGYSKQAPQGMTDPTIDYIASRVNIIVRKLS